MAGPSRLRQSRRNIMWNQRTNLFAAWACLLITALPLADARADTAIDNTADTSTKQATQQPTEAELQQFGPIFEPTRSINMPAAFDYSANSWRSVTVEGDTLFICGNVGKASVWAMIVWYWPEIALVLTLVLILFLVWRIRRAVKRQQVAREPYCRKCNYRLTGSQAANCPECGVKLNDRTRVIGKRRRVVPALVCLIILLAAGGYLAYRWYPPVDDSQEYGFGSDLPREGSVSTWFDWHSKALLEWTLDREIEVYWRDHSVAAYDQLWAIDLRGKKQADCLYDRHAHDEIGAIHPDLRMDRDVIASETDIYIERVHGICYLSTRYGRHMFDVERGIYATIPQGDWLVGVDQNPPFLKPAHDQRYLFDSDTFKHVVMWDRQTWTDPVICPQKVYFAELAEEGALGPALFPIAGRNAVAISWERDPSRLNGNALAVWNADDGTMLELPSDMLGYDLDFIALTDDNRFVISEQDKIFPYILVWDLEKKSEFGFEPIYVPIREADFPASREQPGVVAVAQRGHLLYLHHSEKGYLAWDLKTDDAPTPVGKPMDDEVHWIQKPAETLHAKMKYGAIRISKAWWSDDVIEAIKPPAPLDASDDEEIPLAAGQRLLHSRIGPYVVVYDRKAKKWIGRFHVRPEGFFNNRIDIVTINDDGTLLTVVPYPSTDDDEILVFELPALE